MRAKLDRCESALLSVDLEEASPKLGFLTVNFGPFLIFCSGPEMFRPWVWSLFLCLAPQVREEYFARLLVWWIGPRQLVQCVWLGLFETHPHTHRHIINRPLRPLRGRGLQNYPRDVSNTLLHKATGVSRKSTSNSMFPAHYALCRRHNKEWFENRVARTQPQSTWIPETFANLQHAHFGWRSSGGSCGKNVRYTAFHGRCVVRLRGLKMNACWKRQEETGEYTQGLLVNSGHVRHELSSTVVTFTPFLFWLVCQ